MPSATLGSLINVKRKRILPPTQDQTPEITSTAALKQVHTSSFFTLVTASGITHYLTLISGPFLGPQTT